MTKEEILTEFIEKFTTRRPDGLRIWSYSDGTAEKVKEWLNDILDKLEQDTKPVVMNEDIVA